MAAGERTKLRYEVDLVSPVPVPEAGNALVRSVTRDDLQRLARLMLDAFVGTIDYEGEDLDDAVDEVRCISTATRFCSTPSLHRSAGRSLRRCWFHSRTQRHSSGA